jgi:flagellar secretion chaperone FliS
MNAYHAHTLEGASGVELTIALYDGIIRFMHEAIDAVEWNDAAERRAAVKRAMDVVIHLQATLDRNIGGKPAEALSEFYIAMFAMMLQGSQANSKKKFEQVIANVRNVREAWKQVAAETDSKSVALERMAANTGGATAEVQWSRSDRGSGSSWSA